jgi:protein-disulfide isomerase
MKALSAFLVIAFTVAGLGFPLSAQDSQLSSKITLDRKIELMVRSKFEVPGDCDVRIASRTSSSVPGFDSLHVSVTRGQENVDVELLISSNNKTLAKLEKFDLDNNPALLIDVQSRPVRGNANAPVTVVSFDDLECPVCGRMHQILFPEAFHRYGNLVRFIYKDNPLLDIHPWALHAAVNAHCLANQSVDAYWDYVDYVHSHGQEVSGEARNIEKSYSTLDRIASEQGQKTNVDANQLQACLKKQDEAPVRQSMKEAARLGLNFTPALFVNGEEIHGLTTEDVVWNTIDRALREANVAPTAQKAPALSK